MLVGPTDTLVKISKLDNIVRQKSSLVASKCQEIVIILIVKVLVGGNA